MSLKFENNSFYKALSERILILDGAMGTMIQKYSLSEDSFRGERFKEHNIALSGNNDILNLTMPHVIEDIHLQYLESGADIITTNSFNSNKLSQREYDIDDLCYDLNYEAVKIAKSAKKKYLKEDGTHKDIYIAGSIGPSNCSLFLNSEIRFEEFSSAYTSQIEGLLDGGVDLFLVETVYDTLSCKAILKAIAEVMESRNVIRPIIVSVTLDSNAKLLIGQSFQSFCNTIQNFDNVVGIGINCSFGIAQIGNVLEQIKTTTDLFFALYVNAGLPDADGNYNDTPAYFADEIEDFTSHSKLNIIGGCCGTTPEHIKELSLRFNSKSVKPTQASEVALPNKWKAIRVSEKTNVAGSNRFRTYIYEENYEKAIDFAKAQLSEGCNILDLNFDDGNIDSLTAFRKFIDFYNHDRTLAFNSLFIDSSNFDLVELGLTKITSEVYINSISLEQGEAAFKEKALYINRFGANFVVLASDENGIATTYKRKTDIFQRVYKIIVEDLGISPQKILFDPLILPIASGISEHITNTADVLQTIRFIKTQYPECRTVVGISNLSFTFKGRTHFRKILNSIFLELAETEGLDFAICSPNEILQVESLDDNLVSDIKKVLTGKTNPEVLFDLTDKFKIFSTSGVIKQSDTLSKEMSVYLALIEGDISFIKDIIDKNITKGTSPVEIIETILLPALSEVGDAYNSGEIYLPDVLKCTTNFSNVFDYLNQFCDEANFLLKSKKILLATVRGDVHDIGKNIVSAVLKTNGYEIIDLGVKVDNQIILQKAIENSVDYIAVSGIISPSLHEMEKLAELLFSKNIKIPLIVGGAATSKLHTALKLELLFPEKVLYASNPVNMINSLNSIESNPNYLKDISTEYKSIREEYSKKLCNANDTLWHRPKKVVESFNRPNEIGIWELVDYDLQKILDKLNWKQFYSKWQIKSNSEFAKIAKENLKHDALNLINKVRESKLLEANAIYGIFEAESGESYFDIISQSNVRYRFDIEQIDCTKQNKSVCDYIAKKDYLGLFIATIDINLKNDSLFLELEKKDAYKSLLIKILADSMVEAFAEILHNQIIKNKWVGEDNQREYYSIRPAFGFKMLPNHSQKEIVFQILNAHNIGVSLTETYAMEPASTVCALVINNSKAEYTE